MVIIKSGNYILSLSCEFYQNVVLGLKINEIIINEIQSEDNFINFHNVIKLNSNDIINFENISVNDIEVKNLLIINNNKIKLIKI
jgi:mannose/fructose/N-acetylgalactosamine-specific phosphotransferase system component IIB